MADWSASCQLGFLATLCSFALFGSSAGIIGPEKPHRRRGQLKYYILLLVLQRNECA